MQNSNWVDINKLAEILGFNVETLRRSCANNKYINRFKKSGKYKHYEIDITSLPKNYLNKYNKYFEKDNNLSFNAFSPCRASVHLSKLLSLNHSAYLLKVTSLGRIS